MKEEYVKLHYNKVYKIVLIVVVTLLILNILYAVVNLHSIIKDPFQHSFYFMEFGPIILSFPLFLLWYLIYSSRTIIINEKGLLVKRILHNSELEIPKDIISNIVYYEYFSENILTVKRYGPIAKPFGESSEKVFIFNFIKLIDISKYCDIYPNKNIVDSILIKVRDDDKLFKLLEKYDYKTSRKKRSE